MSKIVTLTDPHIRFKRPDGRREADWLDVCLGQVEQALAIATRIEADAVLCSGDLGDGPAWSPRALVAFMRLLKQYSLPFITTVGQHDVFGHNIDTYEDATLGALEESDLVRVLRRGNFELIGDDIAVYGFAFGENETTALLEGKWVPPEAHKPRFKIGLVHASVGPTESMGWAGIEHQNVRNLNLASFGDIHCGFDPHTFKDGTVAYSTGSLTRSSRSDIGRVPYCGIVEVTDTGWNLDFEEIYDGNDADVFITDEAMAAVGDTAEAFKQVLKTALNYRDETPTNRVKRVGADLSYTDRQITMVLERLEVGTE